MLEQSRHFGHELRKLRRAARMTLDDLAARVHFSKGHLSKVERGDKPAGPDLARLCDAVFEAGGALVALVPEERRRPEAEPPQVSTGDEELWSMELSPDGPSRFEPLGRRQVVARAAASVVGVRMGLPRPPAGPEGETLLEISRSLFGQYRQLGQAAAPEAVLPALIAQTHTLRSLALRAGPRTRAGLLGLASRYAEYIGWLVQETGNDRSALWWTERAVRMAAAGGDDHLAAYALVRRALIAMYRQDAAETISLARQAQRGPLPPRIRGLAAQREAQGHALAGDYDSCMRCLDRARVLLTVPGADPDAPVIGSTSLSDPVAMVTGWCLHDLGRPRRAAEVMDAQVQRLPGDALRSRARYGVRRALAHATAGDIDHACDVVAPLLTATIAVGSATITADLRRLERTLARHPRNSSVRALAPELTAALHFVSTHHPSS